MFRQLWMEIILSGLNSLSVVKPVKVVKDGVAAHVRVLHLKMEERAAGTWGEMKNTLTAMAMFAAQVSGYSSY